MAHSSDTRDHLLVFASLLRSLLKHPVPLVLTLILAGFLRFYLLDLFGLSSDEFASLMIVSKHSLEDIIETCFVIPQPVPPFYFLLCKLGVEVLGAGETGLRFLSVIYGILTVYLVFSIGKTLFDSSVAGWAALLCAFQHNSDSIRTNGTPLCALPVFEFDFDSFISEMAEKRHLTGPVQLCHLHESASLLSLYLFTASAYPRHVLLLVPTIRPKHLSYTTELGHAAVGSCFRDGTAANPASNSGPDSR